jgi:hypothetical protein
LGSVTAIIIRVTTRITRGIMGTAIMAAPTIRATVVEITTAGTTGMAGVATVTGKHLLVS